jgi:hypothetical protein
MSRVVADMSLVVGSHHEQGRLIPIGFVTAAEGGDQLERNK